MISAPSGTSREVITAFVIALNSLDQLNRSGSHLGLLAKPAPLRRDQTPAAERTVFRPNLPVAR